jgi:hypothetical protein
MAANDGSHPVRDLFGVPLPDGTGAVGSSPDRTPPPDSLVPGGVSGLPGAGTAMALSLQAGPGSSASTSQPGQNAPSEIAPGPAGGYMSTGAGGGQNGDHSPRYDWQQPPGGE